MEVLLLLLPLGKRVSPDDPGPRCPLDDMLPPKPNELALRFQLLTHANRQWEIVFESFCAY